MNISDRFGTSSGYIALMCLVNSISGSQTLFPEHVQELWSAPYVSQLLLLPVQALQSWRGLHLSGLKMDFATASSSQDLPKSSSAAFAAPPLDSAVLWARPTSPDEWRAASCQSLAHLHQRKIFHFNSWVQHYVWH